MMEHLERLRFNTLIGYTRIRMRSKKNPGKARVYQLWLDGHYLGAFASARQRADVLRMTLELEENEK